MRTSIRSGGMTPVMTFQLASGLSFWATRGLRPGKKSDSLATVSRDLPLLVVEHRRPSAASGESVRVVARPRSLVEGVEDGWAASNGEDSSAPLAREPGVASTPAGDDERCWGGWRSASARSSRRGKPEVAPCHFWIGDRGVEGS